jgi:Headcase protein family homologue
VPKKLEINFLEKMPQRRDSPSYLDANSPPLDGSVAVCCAPGGCLQSSGHCISLDDIGDVAKVICNYEHCTQSGLMHRQCFHVWEAGILNFLRSCGRARSWSERQRHQNLWTKKGYDLAYKVRYSIFRTSEICIKRQFRPF